MPDLAAVIWTAALAIISLLMLVVGFFLKRTMNTTDEHTKDIDGLKQNRVNPETVQRQGEDINQIKLTYVTKDELQEVKGEIKDDIKALRAEMQANNKETQKELKAVVAMLNEMHKDSISKQDYHRARIEDNHKMERIQQLIIERLGGD